MTAREHIRDEDLRRGACVEEKVLVGDLYRASSHAPRFIDRRKLPQLAMRSDPARLLARPVTWGLAALLVRNDMTPRSERVLGQAKRLLDPVTADALIASLLKSWDRTRHHGGYAWIRRAIALFGGDRTALAISEELARWSSERGAARRHVSFMMDALADIGTDTSKMVLFELTRAQNVTRAWERARNLVKVMARRRGVRVQHLGDLAVPGCGFDGHGKRGLEAAGRQLELTLDEGFELRCDDPRTGERFACPADLGDDPRAREEWEHTLGAVAKAVEVQDLRMEDAMVCGRRWSQSDWNESIFDHPLMINYARRLVWGMFDKDDDLVATFRATEDRELVDVEDDTFTMPMGLTVGLVHPLHLTREILAAWSRSFGDYEIREPIEQLGRATFVELEGRFEGVTLEGRAFRARMMGGLWRHDGSSRGKLELTKGFGHGARAVLRSSPGFTTWRHRIPDQEVVSIELKGLEGLRADIARSETIRTLEAITHHAVQ